VKIKKFCLLILAGLIILAGFGAAVSAANAIMEDRTSDVSAFPFPLFGVENANTDSVALKNNSINEAPMFQSEVKTYPFESIKVPVISDLQNIISNTKTLLEKAKPNGQGSGVTEVADSRSNSQNSALGGFLKTVKLSFLKLWR